MQVPNDIKRRVEQKLRESISVAEKHYGQKFAFPTIMYTKRGRTAGTANPYGGKWEVNFNPILLMENVEDFLARTVPHEMAHLIDYQLHPENHKSRVQLSYYGSPRRTKRDIHGPDWQSIMHVLGADPSRCHTYDTTNAQVRRKDSHYYTCNGCGQTMKLGPKRHKKMQSGAAKYWMRGCKTHGGYAYVGVTPPGTPTPAPRPAPKPKTRKPRATRAGSKLDICRLTYRENYGLTRTEMIDLFVSKAKCTTAGAATYYAKLKKELG